MFDVQIIRDTMWGRLKETYTVGAKTRAEAESMVLASKGPDTYVVRAVRVS